MPWSCPAKQINLIFYAFYRNSRMFFVATQDDCEYTYISFAVTISNYWFGVIKGVEMHRFCSLFGRCLQSMSMSNHTLIRSSCSSVIGEGMLLDFLLGFSLPYKSCREKCSYRFSLYIYIMLIS